MNRQSHSRERGAFRTLALGYVVCDGEMDRGSIGMPQGSGMVSMW